MVKKFQIFGNDIKFQLEFFIAYSLPKIIKLYNPKLAMNINQ